MSRLSEHNKIDDSVLHDVFLSHSWFHKDFARALKDELEQEGKLSVWFDEKRIKEADNMPAEINSGIERSRIFLFVLSSESLRSRWCQDEVTWAAKCNKRIITVLYRSVQFDDSSHAHQVLRTLRWIDCSLTKVDVAAFRGKLNFLICRINENQDYIEKHRQFLIRALDWKRKGYEERRLLSGGLVVEAEEWLQEWDKEATAKETNSNSSDSPTPLHRNFIAESRKHERKRQRLRNAGISISFVMVSIAAIVALWQWQNAEMRQKITEIERLSISSLRQFETGTGELEALIDAVRAGKQLKELVKSNQSLKDYPSVRPVAVLRTVLYNIREKNRLGTEFASPLFTGKVNFSLEGVMHFC